MPGGRIVQELAVLKCSVALEVIRRAAALGLVVGENAVADGGAAVAVKRIRVPRLQHAAYDQPTTVRRVPVGGNIVADRVAHLDRKAVQNGRAERPRAIDHVVGVVPVERVVVVDVATEDRHVLGRVPLIEVVPESVETAVDLDAGFELETVRLEGTGFVGETQSCRTRHPNLVARVGSPQCCLEVSVGVVPITAVIVTAGCVGLDIVGGSRMCPGDHH